MVISNLIDLNLKLILKLIYKQIRESGEIRESGTIECCYPNCYDLPSTYIIAGDDHYFFCDNHTQMYREYVKEVRGETTG